MFLFALFILFFTFYADIVYSNIHSSLGGGKPIPADILISEQGIPIVESLGLTPETDRNIRNISIIYKTPTTIYILPQGKEKVKSIAFPTEIVQGVRFLPEKQTESKQ